MGVSIQLHQHDCELTKAKQDDLFGVGRRGPPLKDEQPTFTTFQISARL